MITDTSKLYDDDDELWIKTFWNTLNMMMG